MARRLVEGRKHFREGELVEVVTVNRTKGDGATNRVKMARKERWKAVVVGPSVMGPAVEAATI